MSDAPAATSKGSLFEDMLEVLWAPASVFDRSRSKGVGMYILVLSLFTLVVMYALKGLLEPYIDANTVLQFQRMADQGKSAPPEAVKVARAFGTWSFIGVSTIMVPIGALITGLLVWSGSKVISAPVSYGQAMLIATLGSIPRLLSYIATAIQGVLVDDTTIRSFADASLGPARFVDPRTGSQALLALLANLDLFSIWQFVLLAIGISVIGRVERSTAFVGALVAWGIGVALSVVPALFS